MAALVNRGIAVLLAVLGLGLAFTPDSVPGLTVPGSPEATRAMQSMDMDGGAVEMKDDSMKGDHPMKDQPMDDDGSMP